MSYFLSPESLQSGQSITITGEEARHIGLSRRLKAGNNILLQGPDGKRFEAVITEFAKRGVTCKVGQEIPVPQEPPIKLSLFQALIAEQALDFILQKSTETGVSTIILFPAKHSPTSFELAKKKLTRWQKITTEAAKQCGRAIVPEITVCKNTAEAIELCQKLDAIFLLGPDGKKLSSLKATARTIGIIVGPEGGLASEEVQGFSGLKKSAAISLGPRTLRADTAAIAGITLLQHAFGDM